MEKNMGASAAIQQQNTFFANLQSQIEVAIQAKTAIEEHKKAIQSALHRIDALKIQGMQRIGVIHLLKELNVLGLEKEDLQKLTKNWSAFGADLQIVLDDIDIEHTKLNDKICQTGKRQSVEETFLAYITKDLGWQKVGKILGQKHAIELCDILKEDYPLLIQKV